MAYFAGQGTGKVSVNLQAALSCPFPIDPLVVKAVNSARDKQGAYSGTICPESVRF